MRAMRPAGLAVAAVAGVLLAGCASPPSVADRTYRGLPDGVQVQLPEQPVVTWIETGARFALVTWGSSSCPRVVTGIEADGVDAVTLRTEPSGGAGPCTADMAATTHELTLPDGVTGRPITVTVTYSDWDETTELTLD